jgi:hypothetical protein
VDDRRNTFPPIQGEQRLAAIGHALNQLSIRANLVLILVICLAEAMH